ncbi:hypothetical protein D9758_016009 [Tetrapyrgos nigripes]|uniref:Uncharacterized protein n=1 Tax=Tetrapyrgos nigripes TaxID=182062 RepID=A0A8H5FNA3_9AGAR|nr:hypothetical protein D9758_016009 [Tetrapyrgos nigripes]
MLDMRKEPGRVTAEPKSDPSQSVPPSTASVSVKPRSVTCDAGRDVRTSAALPQSTGHSIHSNSVASQHSSNAQDTWTDSKVCNVIEEKYLLLKEMSSHMYADMKDKATLDVLGKPNSQDTNKEGGMVPANLSDSVAQITKGLDALLSLITEDSEEVSVFIDYAMTIDDNSEKAQWQVNETEKKGTLHQLLGIPEYQSSYTRT